MRVLMAFMHRPINLETLADFDGFQVHAFCDECRHCSTLDLPGLARRLGGDCPLDRMKRALRCGVCGSRKVSISIGGSPAVQQALNE
ncbi:hypothetical protein CVT23_20865 [Minwuia thermotolerans]|uniref:Uncharacterized protein n=1 Tax=Minwuia thermotolerans TaxID=2056226 RepID=A0A2M9FW58_9PROT|nr:hypothetical protein CVT23_20865 [Minwuia thermotolerans]